MTTELAPRIPLLLTIVKQGPYKAVNLPLGRTILLFDKEEALLLARRLRECAKQLEEE